MSQTNAKIAYGEELQKAQEYLQALQVALTTARGDGTFSNKIHWGHVGDVKCLNSMLERDKNSCGAAKRVGALKCSRCEPPHNSLLN